MPRSEAAAAYLRRLGVDGDLPPTHDTLVALHRAHLDAVPYENLGIMLGRPPSVDPGESLARVGAVGRAGYCFHQNGALGTVLGELGFELSRRHGHVYTTEDDRRRHRAQPPGARRRRAAHRRQPGRPVVGRRRPRRRLPRPGRGHRRPPRPGRLPLRDHRGPRRRLVVPPRPRRHLHRRRGLDAGRPSSPWSRRRTRGSRRRRDGRFAKVLVVQRRDDAGVDTVRGCL